MTGTRQVRPVGGTSVLTPDGRSIPVGQTTISGGGIGARITIDGNAFERSADGDISRVTLQNGTTVDLFRYDARRSGWVIDEQTRIARGLPRIILANAPIDVVNVIGSLLIGTGPNGSGSFLRYVQALGVGQQERNPLWNPAITNPNDPNYEPEFLTIPVGPVRPDGTRAREIAPPNVVTILIDVGFRDQFVGGTHQDGNPNRDPTSSVIAAPGTAANNLPLIRTGVENFNASNPFGFQIIPIAEGRDLSTTARLDDNINSYDDRIFLNLAVPINIRNGLPKDQAGNDINPLFLPTDADPTDTTRLAWFNYRDLPNSWYQRVFGVTSASASIALTILHEFAGHGGFRSRSTANITGGSGAGSNIGGHAAVYSGVFALAPSERLIDSNGRLTARVRAAVDVNRDQVESYVIGEGRARGLFADASGNPDTNGTHYTNSRNSVYIDQLQDIVTRLNARSGKAPITTVGGLIAAANSGELDEADRRLILEVAVFNERPVITVTTVTGGIVEALQVIDGGQIGAALGTVLGRRLTKDPFGQVIVSASLKTILGTLGEFVDTKLFNGTATTSYLGNKGKNFTDSLGQNLIGAGVGALSSYLTAELVRAIGVNGLAGEALNSVGGAVVNQILTNITANIFDGPTKVLQGVNASLLVNAVGSFLGSKLAAEIKTFESVGGQIGGGFTATVALGAIAGTSLAAGASVAAVAKAAAALAAANPVVAVAVVAVVVLVSTLFGGVIGSIFGGTPRSGADTIWDEKKRQFVVVNGYARKGGNRREAEALGRCK
jgi:hypothetical protein